MIRVFAVAAILAAAALPAFAQDIAKETVTLTTSDGVRISAYFVKGKADKAPAVVLLHMLGRTKEDWDPILENYLVPQTDYAYIAIDLRGHGRSVTKGDMAISWQDFKDADFNDMVKDVEAAVAYLRGRKEVSGNLVGIIGASIGANVAINYAAGDPSIKAVALLSPSTDYRGVKTIDAIRKYGDRPLFMAAAREDLQSGPRLNEMKAAAQGTTVARCFDGNIHGTKMFGVYPVEKPVVEFFKEYLKNPGAK